MSTLIAEAKYSERKPVKFYAKLYGIWQEEGEIQLSTGICGKKEAENLL